MSGNAQCGTCRHLSRSTSPGLHTFGKCPHRSGWVRTHDEACPRHDSGGGNAFVRWVIAAHIALAVVGFGFTLYFDVLYGSWLTHVMFGAACACLGLFAWMVRRSDLLSEDAKYILFYQDDRLPERNDSDDLWF